MLVIEHTLLYFAAFLNWTFQASVQLASPHQHSPAQVQAKAIEVRHCPETFLFHRSHAHALQNGSLKLCVAKRVLTNSRGHCWSRLSFLKIGPLGLHELLRTLAALLNLCKPSQIQFICMNRMLAQSYVVKLHKYRCRVVGDQFPFVFIPVQDVFNDDSKENNAITNMRNQIISGEKIQIDG